MTENRSESIESRTVFKITRKIKITFRGYTPAKKDYIHEFWFSEFISREIKFQLQENGFLELISPKITYHVFVCDSENNMEKLFVNNFLEKSHFNYMK